MAGREISVKKYVVKLSAEERERLEAMICAGKHPAQSLTKARILLKADVSEAGEGWSDSAISAALDTSINNIGRTRRRLVEEMAAALTRKHNPNSARPRIFDGAAEAKLIALTCSPAPEGFARWSLRLLEEKVVELNIVEKASDNTIGRTLKKRPQAPPQSAMGDSAGRQRRLRRRHGRRAGNLPEAARSRSPPRLSASKQLIVETRAPIPARPGRAVRHDYEYERNGVANNIFMIFAPLEGWRRVKVTDRHAAADYAQVLKELSDVHFPDAEQIRLVQDNLSTHTPASLYAAFPAPEARRLAKRFEWHYTPKHGSWLDMAESELCVLSSQCLSRRIPDKPTLEKQVAAWEDHRNKHHAKANWQFTTDDARVKLKRLYPSF